MSSSTVPMSIRLDAQARERLRSLAERQKRSAHALAAEAIHQFIDEKEREHDFNQSCIDSYNHYKETGLHLTHEEVSQWMDSLFTEDEQTLPACHA